MRPKGELWAAGPGGRRARGAGGEGAAGDLLLYLFYLSQSMGRAFQGPLRWMLLKDWRESLRGC